MHTTLGHQTHPDIVKRLRRAIGQLNSIVAMIDAERPCSDIAMQLQAVEKAIVQAKKTFIHDHIDHCLEEGVGKTPKAALKEFRDIAKYL